MFFGKDEAQKGKGKRTSGFEGRKEGQFSLGWQVNDNLNTYQQRKKEKEQSMATKVTDTRGFNENKPGKPQSFDDKCRQLIEQNPYITSQELEERMALWEIETNQRPPVSSTVSGRQAPVIPSDSLKDVIYQTESQQGQRQQKQSRRNEGTLTLGDGYNYFKDTNNGRR